MHWIYVIKCNDDRIYVGETRKLFSRLYQHETNRGSKHTSQFKPVSILGLYIVGINYKFFEYVNEIGNDANIDKLSYIICNANECIWNNKQYALEVENFITECILSTNENTFGGKYVNNNRIQLLQSLDDNKKKSINNRPICKCGLPCEVKIIKPDKYYKIYYVCSKKNIWEHMRERFNHLNIPKCCDFYCEYLDDLEYRVKL